MKIFVLGGNGSVGRAFAKLARQERWEILLLDVKISNHPEFKYLQVDCLDVGKISKLVAGEQPDIIVNCINMATIYAQSPADSNTKLILFHQGLYDALSKLNKKISYLHVGTLGTGGLGFNVPFTHGETQDDLPLFHKAALAGVTTSMLVLLSRSLENCQISEIKPSLAIFNKEVISKSYLGGSLVLIDGGENGFYTYNELRTLTSFMGLTTPDRIAAEAMKVLKDERSENDQRKHDVVESVNSTLIEETKEDMEVRNQILKNMSLLQGKNYIIATGNLGPPSITRDLILASLVNHRHYPTRQEFIGAAKASVSVQATLQYINKTNLACSKYLAKEVNYQNYLALKQHETTGEPWEIVRSALVAANK